MMKYGLARTCWPTLRVWATTVTHLAFGILRSTTCGRRAVPAGCHALRGVSSTPPSNSFTVTTRKHPRRRAHFILCKPQGPRAPRGALLTPLTIGEFACRAPPVALHPPVTEKREEHIIIYEVLDVLDVTQSMPASTKPCFISIRFPSPIRDLDIVSAAYRPTPASRAQVKGVDVEAPLCNGCGLPRGIVSGEAGACRGGERSRSRRATSPLCPNQVLEVFRVRILISGNHAHSLAICSLLSPLPSQ